MPSLSREIICPQTCDRRQEDHDLAISEIAVALFLWNRATKKDPWGELCRITKFAQKWKEGDSK